MEVYLQEFVQALLITAIGIIVPWALTRLLKELHGLWLQFKAAKPDLAMELQMAAEYAVKVAESVGLAGALSEWEQTKLDFATDMVQQLLNSKGLKNVNARAIRAAIEDAVKDADFPHVEK
jgi:hypothetical protein